MKNFLFLLGGVILGCFLTIAVCEVIAYGSEASDGIDYFEHEISYENKISTSFEVFQVLGNTALACEISDKKYGWYDGKTVLLLNGNFYGKQIVEVYKPMQVGTFSYKNKGGRSMTVPVISTNIEL